MDDLEGILEYLKLLNNATHRFNYSIRVEEDSSGYLLMENEIILSFTSFRDGYNEIKDYYMLIWNNYAASKTKED